MLDVQMGTILPTPKKMRSTDDYKKQLVRQLGFIERSCNLFNDSAQDEGIRIAVAMRVIFHQTSNSISLFTHLEAFSINLITTCVVTPDPQLSFFNGFGAAQLLSDGTRKLVPNFGHNRPNKFVSFVNWWEQIIWKNDSNSPFITRKQIVLGAANQDGGAHVDTQLQPEYKSLTEDGSAGSYVRVDNDKLIVELSKDAHLMCMRQMGWEVLNSPELSNLAK